MAWRRLGKGGPATTTFPSFLAASWYRAHCSGSALKTPDGWLLISFWDLDPGAGAAWATALDGRALGFPCPLAGFDVPAVPEAQPTAAVATIIRTLNHTAFTLAPPGKIWK